MTNKIAIALIAVLVIAIIVPTAYGQQRDVSKEQYEFVCHNILKDDRKQWHEFGCTYFPEIWNWINELFTTTSDHEYRLQVLEGKVPPPYVELSVNIFPDKISKDGKFTIVGSADRLEQYWVDFEFFDPNGSYVQTEWTNILLNNVYYSGVIEPNHKWVESGNYTVQATHGPHTVNATIQYLGENP